MQSPRAPVSGTRGFCVKGTKVSGEQTVGPRCVLRFYWRFAASACAFFAAACAGAPHGAFSGASNPHAFTPGVALVLREPRLE